MKYLCFVQHQGFEGSIVAENFSSSDPSSNNAMMHGGLDNGGGLISFHRVSENFCCPCVFFFLYLSTVTVQNDKPPGSKLSPERELVHDLYTVIFLGTLFPIPTVSTGAQILQYFIHIYCHLHLL